ncbi:hypothetical protein NDU88_008069 [Pleurodeles waltl]|uniref:Murine leukemia virus integrase C-terminal domain-containing protein n=1 Tax=Pleurodeles waltl TaxID=8319 RepID=A0AAV7ND67_PLEWA|nr:hypothetical protein NDU88_008068 [Pleurodeles waltl]KAJ1110721.1 hypothetical protein NDU88_008069 [Pleurodeles waltl]
MVVDMIPQYESPSVLQKRVADMLGQCCINNDCMSRKRHARERDLQVGDLVLVKNQYPGGKFKLPFDPMLWNVTKVRGTLITEWRGTESKAWNVSFKKYRFRAPDPEGFGDVVPDMLFGTESLAVSCFPTRRTCNSTLGAMLEATPGQRTVVLLAPGDEGGGDPSKADVLSSPEAVCTQRNGSEKYHLRPQPKLSTRLRDFVLT